MHAMHNAGRLRRALLATGICSLVAAAGFSLHIWPFTEIWPLGDASTIDLYLGAYMAAIGVSLLWIGMSGELGAAVAGAISLTITYFSLAISLVVLTRGAADPAALLCIGAAILSAGTALWLRRCRIRDVQIRDVRPLHRAVRLSFAAFALLLGVVGFAVLLRIPSAFPLILGPASAALVGCSFLGSAAYFLYSVVIPDWQNAHAPLWGFLAYDLVLIVPFVLQLGGIDGARLPALVVNIAVLVYSGALAVYYLLIAEATRVLGPSASRVHGQDIGKASATQHPQIDPLQEISVHVSGGPGDCPPPSEDRGQRHGRDYEDCAWPIRLDGRLAMHSKVFQRENVSGLRHAGAGGWQPMHWD